jgi:cereblon
MIGYVTIGKDDKKGTVYHCSVCGAKIAHSTAIVRIAGAEEHSFVNPMGIRFDFRTFAACENVLIHKDLFFRHSWFRGYGWRFLNCEACFQHLGWKYDAVVKNNGVASFYGVLVDAVIPSQEYY